MYILIKFNIIEAIHLLTMYQVLLLQVEMLNFSYKEWDGTGAEVVIPDAIIAKLKIYTKK